MLIRLNVVRSRHTQALGPYTVAVNKKLSFRFRFTIVERAISSKKTIRKRLHFLMYNGTMRKAQGKNARAYVCTYPETTSYVRYAYAHMHAYARTQCSAHASVLRRKASGSDGDKTITLVCANDRKTETKR